VKRALAGSPTLYAGYTNEILGYLPTAAEYQCGGYEAGYGYKSVGLPSLFDPGVEQLLVTTGVRLAERLFPDAEPWDAIEAGRPGASCRRSRRRRSNTSQRKPAEARA